MRQGTYWSDNRSGGHGFEMQGINPADGRSWERALFGWVEVGDDESLYDEQGGPHSPRTYSRTPAYGFVESPEIEWFLLVETAIVQVRQNYEHAVAEDPTLITRSKRKYTDEQLRCLAPRAHSLMHLCQMLDCSTSNYAGLRKHLIRLGLMRPVFMSSADRRRVRAEYEKRTIGA